MLQAACSLRHAALRSGPPARRTARRPARASPAAGRRSAAAPSARSGHHVSPGCRRLAVGAQFIHRPALGCRPVAAEGDDPARTRRGRKPAVAIVARHECQIETRFVEQGHPGSRHRAARRPAHARRRAGPRTAAPSTRRTASTMSAPGCRSRSLASSGVSISTSPASRWCATRMRRGASGRSRRCVRRKRCASARGSTRRRPASRPSEDSVWTMRSGVMP